MAGKVESDGQVVPPLNIDTPNPSLDLKGFHWSTVDKKVLGSEATPGSATIKVTAREAAPLPAPRLPLSTSVLPDQLADQLELNPGAKPEPAPVFPLAQFQGAYAGNGFNLIFRPSMKDDPTPFPNKPTIGPNDNVLLLNLTQEHLSFGKTIGQIPNRGLLFNNQPDINLGGFPYLQTIKDVTNPSTGKGDNLEATDIHFETGVWLNVPATDNPKNDPSIVRMGSIPHGTTINAQGLSPAQSVTALGGTVGPPSFSTADNVLDTTPFSIGDVNARAVGVFKSMDADLINTPRIPQDLTKFKAAGTINTDIIKNPNIVLQNAIKGQTITETITFQVSTGPPTSVLNGGGTANISFLSGPQSPVTTATPGAKDAPNADAAFMTVKYWIETVAYKVNVPKLTTNKTILLKPTMPQGSTAPTPVFAITPPANLPSEAQTITVPGIQVQSSQLVNLNFGPPGGILTWPHVSVATLVPTGAQPFQMA